MIKSKVQNYQIDSPLPVKILYALLIINYCIYIPVSLFKSNVFLLIYDVLLILMLLLTIANKTVVKRIFNGKKVLLLLIVLYGVNLLIVTLLDFRSISIESIKTIRNLTYGLGIFIISSIWCNQKDYVNIIIKILVVGSLITGIYGFRQILFGFMDFELDRLKLMGASFKEYEVLGRARMTSSFGDPLTCAFFMMVGYLALFIAKSRGLLHYLTEKKRVYISAAILIISLILTLTRAPLFGLLVGSILIYPFYNWNNFRNISGNIKYIIIILCVVFLVGGVSKSYVIDSSRNYHSSNIQKITRHGVSSFISIFQSFEAFDANSKVDVILNQSQRSRISSWGKAINYIRKNPFGGGLNNSSNYSYSLVDIGLLSYGIKSGMIGFLSMILILFYIGINYYRLTKAETDVVLRKESYLYLSLWIAIIVTGLVSEILQNSSISIVVWTIGGILTNYKRRVQNAFRY